MTPLALLWHLLNFVAPAAGVGLFLALALSWRHGCAVWSAWWRLALLGGVVLIVGWIALQRDGAMATYAALVLIQGTLAWWWARQDPSGRSRR